MAIDNAEITRLLENARAAGKARKDGATAGYDIDQLVEHYFRYVIPELVADACRLNQATVDLCFTRPTGLDRQILETVVERLRAIGRDVGGIQHGTRYIGSFVEWPCIYVRIPV